MVGDYPLAESSQIPGDNQSIDLDVSSTTFGLIGSADLKIVVSMLQVSGVE